MRGQPGLCEFQANMMFVIIIIYEANKKKLCENGARAHNGLHFNIGLYKHKDFLTYGYIELEYKYLQNVVQTGLPPSQKSWSIVYREEFWLEIKVEYIQSLLSHIYS